MNDPSKWVYKETGEKYNSERHERERVENGFSTYDWWNFCDYMAWVNVQALERFKAGAGYPGNLNNMDEWQAELDIMIAGFNAHMRFSNLDYDFRDEAAVDELIRVKDEGLALYAKRFSSLWD